MIVGNVWPDKCEKCGTRVPDDRELTAVPVNPDPATDDPDGGATVTEYMLLCEQCEFEMIGVDD